MGKSSGAGQHGPRDTGSILASRYVLTDKGEAAVEAIRAHSHSWTFGNTPGVKVCRSCGECAPTAARIAARARAGRREG